MLELRRSVSRIGFYVENHVVGGSERYLADVMSGLETRGYYITLFSNNSPALVTYLAKRGLSHIPHRVVPSIPMRLRHAVQTVFPRRRSEAPVVRAQASLRGSARHLLGGLWRWAVIAPNYALLRKAFRTASIDLLHVNNGGYPAAETCRIAALAGAAEGRRCVMTVHGPAEPPVWPTGFERWLDRRVIQSVDTLVAAAGSTAQSLRVARGMPPEKIRTVNLGLEIVSPIGDSQAADIRRSLGLPAGATVVGMVGRFDWYKGHRVLLEAAARLSGINGGAALRFLLVGDGDELCATRKLAEELGLNARVTFTGFYPDAAAAMSACDVLTMLSVGYEGQGYVILEAMLQGRPVVASDLCGMREVVVDEETGILVPACDSGRVAAALLRLARDPQLRRRMGSAGRRRVETHFGLSRMLDELEEVYQRG